MPSNPKVNEDFGVFALEVQLLHLPQHHSTSKPYVLGYSFRLQRIKRKCRPGT